MNERLREQRERAERARQALDLRMQFSFLDHLSEMSLLGSQSFIDEQRTTRGLRILSLLPPSVTQLDVGEGIVVERSREYLDQIPEEDRVSWTLNDAKIHQARLDQQIRQDRKYPPYQRRLR